MDITPIHDPGSWGDRDLSNVECFEVRDVSSPQKPADFRSLWHLSSLSSRAAFAVTSAELDVFFCKSFLRKTSLILELVVAQSTLIGFGPFTFGAMLKTEIQ